jgi:chromosome segregation ATPase
MSDDIAFTSNLQIKENSNVSNMVLSGTDYLKNEEMTEFVDKLIRENCSMKKELIMKEIEVEKHKEMLKNASIKYYNLETGTLNNTDKIYFEKIRKINLENDYKLNQINIKYENEFQKLLDEHNKIVNELRSNDNIINNEEENKNEEKLNDRIDIENNKLEEYLQRIKILEEEKFTSEKRYQLVQQKYDVLLEENKMIKNKIKEEKENILFILEELKKENNLKKDEIVKEFKDKTNLITQHFISFSDNEKEKANLVLENLLNEQKTLNDKIEMLEEENAKLSEENNLLIEKTKSNDEFMAQKEIEMLSIDNIKQNFHKSLSNYEKEIEELTKTNLSLKKQVSELEAKVNALNLQNENLEKSINSQIDEINEQNGKIINDLNSQIIQLEQQKREINLKYKLYNENESNMKIKLKDLNQKNTELNRENSNLKYKNNEYEINIQLLKGQLEKMNQNFEKMHQQYSNMDKEFINSNNNLNINRKMFENEEEIKNLKENIKILESINEKNNKELTETKKINLNLNHTIDNLKLKYDNEIEIYKNKINEYENKLNEIYSNNNYEE